nr:probable receptor-like protein kinase At5g61350 [Ipomoea batatas]
MSAGALSLPEFGLEGVDDVEDIPSASEGDSSMSFERFSHLQDLVRMGNNAFRDNRLDEVDLFPSRLVLLNCFTESMHF